MGEAIVVSSGKGGVGKTTSSVNIGTALALSGKRVCLVDGDIGLRNLDVMMGLENRIIYDLVDAVEGECRLQQALIKDKRFDHLFLLPAKQTKDKNAITPEQMEALIMELKQDFDYIIIDCPAGIEQGFKNAVIGADHAIVVTVPEPTAVRDADRVIGLLEKEKTSPPKLIINRIRYGAMKQGDMLDVDDVIQQLGIEILGIVPDDPGVIKASKEGEAIVMNHESRAGLAYRNIGRRILGDQVALLRLEEPNQGGFFRKVKSLFGIK
ncbi:septum site-determining protein MinD [Ammoniphilus oxalaticus]|uniref:Septum site-determining protein MinD n=1 Tax=Ammoniphilus oxalaticus TaxID=66863 RepID=A0A419SIW7_9BACL|nr:septum site-determining protein MinD [Ammoniphilus oxalaticus]RKD23900.1 septum site-determining protein MinD [Ammoniphilus oxalaticus]